MNCFYLSQQCVVRIETSTAIYSYDKHHSKTKWKVSAQRHRVTLHAGLGLRLRFASGLLGSSPVPCWSLRTLHFLYKTRHLEFSKGIFTSHDESLSKKDIVFFTCLFIENWPWPKRTPLQRGDFSFLICKTLACIKFFLRQFFTLMLYALCQHENTISYYIELYTINRWFTFSSSKIPTLCKNNFP